MNKSIEELKKQFKKNNSSIQFSTVYNYLLTSKGEVTCIGEKAFNRIEDEEERTIILQNFKKVLSGKEEEKMFTTLLQTKEKQEELMQLKNTFNETNIKLLLKNLASNCSYEKDVNVSVTYGKYSKIPKLTKKQKKEIEAAEGEFPQESSFDFIILTINPIVAPKKNINVDYQTKEMYTDNSTKRVIKFTAPIEGFLFPYYEKDAPNEMQALYYTTKKNEPNTQFVNGFLGGQLQIENRDDRRSFNELIHLIHQDNCVDMNTLSGVYNELLEVMKDKTLDNEEDLSEVTLSFREVAHMFERNGMPNIDQIESYCKEIGSDAFKLTEIVPPEMSRIVSDDWELIFPTATMQERLAVEQSNEGYILKVQLRENIRINGLKIK